MSTFFDKSLVAEIMKEMLVLDNNILNSMSTDKNFLITEKKVYEKVFDIARIYSYKGNPNIPLGDIFIIARLSLYSYNVCNS